MISEYHLAYKTAAHIHNIDTLTNIHKTQTHIMSVCMCVCAYMPGETAHGNKCGKLHNEQQTWAPLENSAVKSSLMQYTEKHKKLSRSI